MDDKTLLERAAKAARHIRMEYRDEVPYVSVNWNGEGFVAWNPLQDDGDALRLAIKLDLAITPYPVYEKLKHSVLVQLKNLDHSKFEVIELYGFDQMAATRRAIVRAAAAIGSAHEAR